MFTSARIKALGPAPRRPQAARALGGRFWRASDSAEVSAEGGDHHGDDVDQCLGERESHGYERLISFINRYLGFAEDDFLFSSCEIHYLGNL